jgi:two-component system KDP operon response regulator KdpE
MPPPLPYITALAAREWLRPGHAIKSALVSWSSSIVHILLVDDDPMVRHTLRAGIEFRQHQVSEAGDGRTALELLRQAKADLAVVDMNMPMMSGTATASAIRNEFPDVKIIFLTGSAHQLDEDTQGLAEWLGAIAVLQKPIRPRELCVIEGAFAPQEPRSARASC